MSRHPRGVPQTRQSVEVVPDSPAPDSGIPPPLEEIVARSRSGPVSDGRTRRKRRSSRSETPQASAGTKRRGARSSEATIAPGEMVVGTFVGISDLGEPLIEHPLSPDSERPSPTRSTVPLDPGQIGREVVLTFERGDPRYPIILGILRRPGEVSTETPGTRPAPNPTLVEVQRDDERLVLTAEREIVLRCGEASITLTRTGKILLRGTYLLSRSSGVNRIKGGSVQIN